MNELRTAARKVRSLPNQMVRVGAGEMKRPLLDAAARATGGDRRLSGLRGGGKLNVSVRVSGVEFAKGRVVPGPKAMRGPWVWVNTGTSPRRQGRGWHPGTRGTGAWDRTVDRELPNAQREMLRLFEHALR